MNTLRKILIGAGSAALLAGLSTAASAQPAPTSPAPTLSATATATMSATIQSPLTVAKTTDLSFGTLLKPVSGAAVAATLAPDGTRTYTGGAATGTPSAATFTVTSSAGTAFTPTATASGAITTLTGWALDDSENVNGVANAIPAAQTTKVLRYGATFNLAPDTPTGVYNGSLLLTVNYQ